MSVHLSNGSSRTDAGSETGLRIGLVNNMPESAFTATERQFTRLLQAAAKDIPVTLSRYCLPEIGVPGPHRAHYASTQTLQDTQLDGLIVTGREPKDADLREEPYWESFTSLLDWAGHSTQSTIWSCLAAHAAVLYLDGIERRRRKDKFFGIFECSTVSEHELSAAMPRMSLVPHSRWNGIAGENLVSAGYTVLARSDDGEIDTFLREDNSLFLFFQGHPEYESDTLLREYRRDALRFLRGEVGEWPHTPLHYFSPKTEEMLDDLRLQAASGHLADMPEKLSQLLGQETIANTWHAAALARYRNWLKFLTDRKYDSHRVSAASPLDSIAI